MLKVTIKFSPRNEDKIVYTNIIHVVVYLDGDKTTEAFVSMSYRNKATNRVEYVNCYRRPFDVIIEPTDRRPE